MSKQVAKGCIQADNSYQYTCGNCGGSGFLLDSQRGEELCVHCYNGNYAKIVEEMKTARGQRYYALLKSALKIAGKSIADKALALRAEHGKLTPLMLAYLACHFQFNLKALIEWLSECRIVPTGLYEELMNMTYTNENGKKQRVTVRFLTEKAKTWFDDFGKEWDSYS